MVDAVVSGSLACCHYYRFIGASGGHIAYNFDQGPAAALSSSFKAGIKSVRA